MESLSEILVRNPISQKVRIMERTGSGGPNLGWSIFKAFDNKCERVIIVLENHLSSHSLSLMIHIGIINFRI